MLGAIRLTLERAVQDRTRELSEREGRCCAVSQCRAGRGHHDRPCRISDLLEPGSGTTVRLFRCGMWAQPARLSHARGAIWHVIRRVRSVRRNRGQGALLGRTTGVGQSARTAPSFGKIALSAVKLHGQWSAVGIVRDIGDAQADRTAHTICHHRHLDRRVCNAPL